MLSGALRISTKYEIAALREWCIQELRSRWPQDLERMGTTSLPHAAGKQANIVYTTVIETVTNRSYISGTGMRCPRNPPRSFLCSLRSKMELLGGRRPFPSRSPLIRPPSAHIGQRAPGRCHAILRTESCPRLASLSHLLHLPPSNRALLAVQACSEPDVTVGLLAAP